MLDSAFRFRESNICMTDLNFLSAVSMAEQIRQKKISPVELIEAHLEQIKRLNPSLNAFLHLNAERALRDARPAEAAVMSEAAAAPLHGFPATARRSLNVPGMHCADGTPLRP